MQDEEIIRLYLARDENAIAQTEAKYGKYLGKLAYNVLADTEDSREAVNDALLAAWSSIPPHKPAVLLTYLIKLTRRITIDRLRQRGREKRRGSQYAVSLTELDECIPTENATERATDAKLLAEAINRYLAELPQQ